MSGHNHASHQWQTTMYGDNMHPRELNSINIAHTDAINYGRLSAIDRCIVTVGKRKPVYPALNQSPIPINYFYKEPKLLNANWGQFYRKYLLSQPECKYDKALSIDTNVRSSNFVNTNALKRYPNTSTLLRPDDGKEI